MFPKIEENILTIMPNGILLKTNWVYDEEKDTGEWITEDITEHTPKCMNEFCTIGKNVILKDIFQLMNKHIDFFSILYYHYFGKDLIEEFMKIESKICNYLEYLEIYRNCYISKNHPSDENENETEISNYLGFHGIGFPLKEEQNGFKIDEQIQYSLMVANFNELINLPVKILKKDEILEYNNDINNNTINHGEISFEYTLNDILYIICHELTWMGVKERDKKIKEFDKDCNSEDCEIETEKKE